MTGGNVEHVAAAVALVRCHRAGDDDGAAAILAAGDAGEIALALAGICSVTLEFAAVHSNLVADQVVVDWQTEVRSWWLDS